VSCALFFSPLFIPSANAVSETQVQIEDLRNQIQDMKMQHQRRMEEIERDYRKKIEEIEKRINDMQPKQSPEEQKEQMGEDKVELVYKKKGPRVKPSSPSIELLFNTDFPSYYRTRARVFKNATFAGAVPGEDDDIFFVDSRLLLSPMLKIGDKLSIRSQLDIAKNIVWGGLTDESVTQKVFEAPSPTDSFRGALLRDVTDTLSGGVTSPVDKDEDFFDIRSLYVVAEIPIGELWIGRQPFDWGLGILNNAGSMPDQDLGSIVDRFEFDTAPFSLLDKRWEDLVFFVIVDRLAEGQRISTLDEGDGWEVGGGIFYEGKKLKLGGYIFSVYQNNFDLSDGLSADISPAINWSLYFDYKSDIFRFALEFEHLFGDISDLDAPLPDLIGSDNIDITAGNFLLGARAEFYPRRDGTTVVALEGGVASGDDASTPDKLEGGGIFFNNAFTIDNLLFKHIIPTVYATEGSVINSWYFRGWSTVRLNESLYFTPQALFAWVDKKNALGLDVLTPLSKVDRFLGTELEGTLTWKILDRFWFDFIGSVVIAGGGLDDLISQRAFIEGVVSSVEAADPPSTPFAFQWRLVILLDSTVKGWSGSSSFLPRFY